MTNEQIAKDVMGCTVYDRYKDPEYFYADNMSACRINDFVVDVPDFLNCHNAAMMVVEKMREDGYYMKIEMRVADNSYEVKFSKPFRPKHSRHSENESLCHAIAEAALKAKGETP